MEVGGIIVALLALLGTIINARAVSGKASRNDAVETERRLTLIETSIQQVEERMMTRGERRTLIELGERVSVLMATVTGLIPRMKNPPSLGPLLDALSEAGEEQGWEGVVRYLKVETSAEKREELFEYLETRAVAWTLTGKAGELLPVSDWNLAQLFLGWLKLDFPD